METAPTSLFSKLVINFQSIVSRFRDHLFFQYSLVDIDDGDVTLSP
jgi:hypothetical protein